MKLLLVHGSGGCHLSFYYQTRYFRDSDAVDLPGHPEGKPCTSIEENVEWLRQYINVRGYQDVILGGHSMGGAVALCYGLKYPEELKGLVLIGTGARLRVHPDYLRECAAATDPDNVARWLEHRKADLSNVDPKVSSQFIQVMERIGPTVYLEDYLCCDKFDIMDRLQDISLPTLVVVGSKDIMTPVKYANYLNDNIPKSRLEIVEGATHYVHLEKPSRVNQVLDEFLTSLK